MLLQAQQTPQQIAYVMATMSAVAQPSYSMRSDETKSVAATGWCVLGTGAPAVIAEPVSTFDESVRVIPQCQLDWLEFQGLAQEWKLNRKRASSFAGSFATEPHYLRIIGMGERAIRYILHQLQDELEAGQPDHWFTALWAITNENPTPPESQGRVREMAHAWLAWGEEKGLLDAEGLGSRIS